METEKLAVRVSEWAEMISVSRSKGYEIVAAHPEIAVKIGGSTRVLVDKGLAWLAKQQAQSNGEAA